MRGKDERYVISDAFADKETYDHKKSGMKN